MLHESVPMMFDPDIQITVTSIIKKSSSNSFKNMRIPFEHLVVIIYPNIHHMTRFIVAHNGIC